MKYIWDYNLNQRRRDEIMEITTPDFTDATFSFEGLTAEKLQLLVDENFVHLDDRGETSPKLKVFLNFMKKHPEFTAFGYVVGLDRSDYRVAIEGLEGDPKGGDIQEFITLFRRASEFECGPQWCRCWYD